MNNSFLSSTISNPEEFDKVFTEVTHDGSLGLVNENEIRIFQMNIQDYHFLLDELKDFLDINIGRYVLSRAARDGLEKSGKRENIASKASRLLRSKGKIDIKGTGNELGEMLIYIFLEKVLGAPKLMSKVELDFLGNTSETEAVHLHSTTHDGAEINQLVFGASSIVGDLGDAISQVEHTLLKINVSKREEIKLIEENILSESFDDETTKKIMQLLIPSEKAVPHPEPAYGIFLGYTLGIDHSNRTPSQYEQQAQQKIKDDIAVNIPRIAEIINKSNLSGYSFYIYILPFNDAENDKLDIMDYVLGGGNL
ncbi:DUF1837 domain-containing protein [Enterococcus thailandicus]|uniref:HamA C-terminal domain-containing protein n=1 Tax=Enterococcus thailandicus TaxID=417368 RepID=UPI0022E8B190|nr:DUF1837 domain-containing protein [Enterococcus thailandicus]